MGTTEYPEHTKLKKNWNLETFGEACRIKISINDFSSVYSEYSVVHHLHLQG
jgi:hypothetical protein